MQESAPDTPGANVPEYSVSELAQALKRTVEGAFGQVRVRGEISGFKRAASGHVYFALKDSDALLDAVMWRGTAGALRFRPEDGLEVICTGRLTTYPGRSRYQIVVERMEPAGAGALMALLEERRRRLLAEGLFAPERKRPLPYLPTVIGVVTSPTGAVIRDILHRIADRFPRRVLLWPVPVQGEGAAARIAAAIEGFNALPPDGLVPRPDLLIVARGGGSVEDLWAFNEEVVVRAAAASAIPLIAAVGHETDTTLIDFAADVRAPTPTAAAEMAVPVRAELMARVLEGEQRLGAAMAQRLLRTRERLEALGRGLPAPARLVETAAQRLDDAAQDLTRGLRLRLERGRARLAAAPLPRPHALIRAARGRLEAAAALLARDLAHGLALRRAALASVAKLLESLSYQRILERGFVLVQTAAGAVVASRADASPGLAVTLRFHDGSAPATIGDGGPGGGSGPGAGGATGAAAPARRRRGGSTDQGSLL